MAVPMVSFVKAVNFADCKRREALFSAADNMFHHVLRIIVCSRHNPFASFSEDELYIYIFIQCLWQAQRVGDLHGNFGWQV